MKQCPICGNLKTKAIASNVGENLGLIGGRYCYLRCEACKVISQQPLPASDLLSKYYTLIDQRQQAWQATEGAITPFKNKTRHRHRDSLLMWLVRSIATAGEQLYPYWHQLKPGSILDLGAGSGGFCLEASQRGWRVIGIEQSRVSVEQARYMGFDLIETDLASPEASQLIASATNVVMNHVFEHVLDPIGFLRMLRSTIVPGSRFILLIPNPNSIWRLVFGRHWYGWDPPVHVHHYSDRALKKMLEIAGFSVLKVSSVRRNDSLSTALSQIGIKPGFLRFALRALMIPLMPFFAWAGLGPELLCIADAKPALADLAWSEVN